MDAPQKAMFDGIRKIARRFEITVIETESATFLPDPVGQHVGNVAGRAAGDEDRAEGDGRTDASQGQGERNARQGDELGPDSDRDRLGCLVIARKSSGFVSRAIPNMMIASTKLRVGSEVR